MAASEQTTLHGNGVTMEIDEDEEISEELEIEEEREVDEDKVGEEKTDKERTETSTTEDREEERIEEIKEEETEDGTDVVIEEKRIGKIREEGIEYTAEERTEEERSEDETKERLAEITEEGTEEKTEESAEAIKEETSEEERAEERSVERTEQCTEEKTEEKIEEQTEENRAIFETNQQSHQEEVQENGEKTENVEDEVKSKTEMSKREKESGEDEKEREKVDTDIELRKENELKAEEKENDRMEEQKVVEEQIQEEIEEVETKDNEENKEENEKNDNKEGKENYKIDQEEKKKEEEIEVEMNENDNNTEEEKVDEVMKEEDAKENEDSKEEIESEDTTEVTENKHKEVKESGKVGEEEVKKELEESEEKLNAKENIILSKGSEEDEDNLDEETNEEKDETLKDEDQEKEDEGEEGEEREEEEAESLDENANTKTSSVSRLEDMDAIVAELSDESEEEEEELEEDPNEEDNEEEEEEETEESLAAKEDLAKKRTSLLEHLTAVRRESVLRKESLEEGDEGIEEEFEEFPEMSDEEKQAMHGAVKAGDIELLDDLLDLPAADINMELYGENLLMTACRHHRKAMAEFLIDNGVNYNFQMSRLVESENPDIRWDVYRVNCRNFAYRCDMMDIVEEIDHRNGELWPFIHPTPRAPRLKRPLEEKRRERGELIEEEEEEEGEKEEEEGDGEDEVDGEKRKEKQENQEIDGDGTGPLENSDGRTSRQKESPSEVKLSASPISQPKSSQVLDTEATDDASSGYDTMSECTDQGTVVILCNPEQPTVPVKQYHQNKAFLSRRRENEKYKTVPEHFAPKIRPSTSDCLTNIVWHSDIKPKKTKPSNKDTIRLQSPWKKDRPVERPLPQSRVKSAPENHWPNSKSRRQDFQLPELSIAWGGNRLSGVRRSESTLYQTPRSKTAPMKKTVTNHTEYMDQRSFGRGSTGTTAPHLRSYSSLGFQSLSSCPSRSLMATSLTTTRLLPEPGHKQKKQSPAGLKRTNGPKPGTIDLRAAGKRCHFRQATTMW